MDDFDPEAAALAVTEGLRPLGTLERAAREKRYLKSGLDFLGVPVPDLRRVVKAAVRAHPGLDAQGMVASGTHQTAPQLARSVARRARKGTGRVAPAAASASRRPLAAAGTGPHSVI